MNPVKSLKWRMTLWYAAMLAVLLGAVSFWMYSELAKFLYADMDSNLRREAYELERSLEGALPEILPLWNERLREELSGTRPQFSSELRARLQDAFREFRSSESPVGKSTLMVRLIAYDRTPLASNLKGWEQDIIFPDFERDSGFMESGTSFQTIHFKRMPVRLFYKRVDYQGSPLYLVQCGASLADVETALNRLFLIMMIAIPLAVLASCAAGWFLANRSLKPIDTMIRQARRVTAAYLKERLPRSGAGDEIDRLAETLNEMMDRLETSTRAIQDFSSDISHELKTPLAVIRGEIDLALRKPRSQEELLETLRVTGGEVDELIRLVNDLILLVKSDARELHFEKHPLDLRDLLLHLLQRYEQIAKEKRIHLEQDLGSEAMILGDAVYLKRLFSNLFDNALKFTPPEGVVRVQLRVQLSRAVVLVTDTGIGIELDQQTKVFSRFYRTEQARSADGAGLGLNIAKAIADAHEAAIRIASQPGRGTQVSVEFPQYSRD